MEKERHIQMVAALAMMEKEPLALEKYLAAESAGVFQSTVSILSKAAPESRSEEAQQLIRALRASQDFSGIAEIHPAWLLEVLRNESPRIIGVILRYLPSKHVRYLLEHFPHRIRLRLPKLIESFYVPNEILDLIRRKVERHFVPMRISHDLQQLTFDKLYYLKMEELEILFRDLGVSELALSLVGSSPKVTKVVLNRFMIRDGKEIMGRIRRFQGLDSWFIKEAKFSIFEVAEEELGPDRFLTELGLLAFAKASLNMPKDFYQIFRQKLQPKDAYMLKRIWDEKRGQSQAERNEKRQAWVLEHVERLGKAERIDSFWAECVAHREAA